MLFTIVSVIPACFPTPCAEIGGGQALPEAVSGPPNSASIKRLALSRDFTLNERLTRPSAPLFWGRELARWPHGRVGKCVWPWLLLKIVFLGERAGYSKNRATALSPKGLEVGLDGS